MTLSLIVVTLAFTGLLLWVYWPSNRDALEKQGQLIFEPGERVEGRDEPQNSGRPGVGHE